MKISEIFYSVQGEGLTIGQPSIFIRLSGCNKKCSWCDSKYSWNEGESKTIFDIIKEVRKYNCYNIVITGGEPLLQQSQLIKLMEQLLEINPFYHFEIETNGTIAPTKRLAELTDLFNVSPKFENFSYATEFSNICDLSEHPNLIFKFVVEKEEDMKLILDFNKKYNYRQHEVFLTPCAISISTMIAILPFLSEQAKIYNFRVTPRLQILTYGNKRGV